MCILCILESDATHRVINVHTNICRELSQISAVWHQVYLLWLWKKTCLFLIVITNFCTDFDLATFIGNFCSNYWFLKSIGGDFCCFSLFSSDTDTNPQGKECSQFSISVYKMWAEYKGRQWFRCMVGTVCYGWFCCCYYCWSCHWQRAPRGSAIHTVVFILRLSFPLNQIEGNLLEYPRAMPLAASTLCDVAQRNLD